MKHAKIDMEICPICYKEFEPETTTWARNTVLGEEALGRDPNLDCPWYGRQKWRSCDVEEFDVPITDRCADCEERRLDTLQRSREYSSPCQASWFDPCNCGERWGEDD